MREQVRERERERESRERERGGGGESWRERERKEAREQWGRTGSGRVRKNFIVSDALLKANGLRSPGTNFVDKTVKHHYKPHFWSGPTSGTKFVPGLGAFSQ